MDNQRLRIAFNKASNACRNRIDKAVLIGESEIVFDMVERMIVEAGLSDERIVIIADIPIFDVQRIRESITNKKLGNAKHFVKDIEAWDLITHIVEIEQNEIVENMIIRMITRLGLSDEDIKSISSKTNEEIQEIRERIENRTVEYVKDGRRKYLWDYMSQLNGSYADGIVQTKKETAIVLLGTGDFNNAQIADITDLTIDEVEWIREEAGMSKSV
ncbi:hypothetical protein [Bacillus bombysepticus]|uniref:hypothetical protein n=1 Tax=Bacillus bombysepticus TaxID=658666 RepID=UPI003016336D